MIPVCATSTPSTPASIMVNNEVGATGSGLISGITQLSVIFIYG